MEQKLINRINELAKKSKKEGLTAEETEEREKLRKEYIKQFREGMRKNIMDNLYIVDEKGNKTKVERKKTNN
jgi:uncharacterized protein YnzC (UPF0291/DUF896 family)